MELVTSNFLTRMGRTWFQWRGFSPVPALLFVILMPVVVMPSRGEAFVLACVIFGAEAVRVWAVGFAGSVTRTRGDSVPSLVCAGPFRFVRNPLYIANIALYVAWALLFGLGPYSVFVGLYFAIQYSFIVQYEETLLYDTFGAAYREYQSRVPRWWPRLVPVETRSDHRFSLAASLRSERSTLLAIALTALACWLKVA